jgi:hypothetical protein
MTLKFRSLPALRTQVAGNAREGANVWRAQPAALRSEGWARARRRAGRLRLPGRPKNPTPRACAAAGGSLCSLVRLDIQNLIPGDETITQWMLQRSSNGCSNDHPLAS